jgi:hypothetical protein
VLCCCADSSGTRHRDRQHACANCRRFRFNLNLSSYLLKCSAVVEISYRLWFHRRSIARHGNLLVCVVGLILSFCPFVHRSSTGSSREERCKRENIYYFIIIVMMVIIQSHSRGNEEIVDYIFPDNFKLRHAFVNTLTCETHSLSSFSESF